MAEHHSRSEDRPEGVRNILACDRWRGAVHRLEHGCLSGMNVTAGGHTQAALQACGEVGDDVAEEVVGYDNIELARVADHLGTECINIEMLGCDLLILLAHPLEHTLP